MKAPKSRCYTLAFGMDLLIDPERRIVMLDGQELNLTRKEFDLLFFLASHEGQELSREELYSLVWNNENAYDIDEAVKSQIKTLRKKLTAYNREYIKNIEATLRFSVFLSNGAEAFRVAFYTELTINQQTGRGVSRERPILKFNNNSCCCIAVVRTIVYTI